MYEKDKIIVTDSTMAIVESIVESIPGLNLAWKLSVALLGAGLKLRQKRAFEWVEMIKDHPEVFTKDLLSTEEFQDSFVISLEKYARERKEENRGIVKNIFLGYARNKNIDFEKYYSVLSLLSSGDIELLKKIEMHKGATYLDSQVNYLYSLGLLDKSGDMTIMPGGSSSGYKLSEFGQNLIKFINT